MFLGIQENEGENTDEVVLRLVNKKMETELAASDIHRIHRIGKKKISSNKPRPIIVKLTRYNVRNKMFKTLNV